MRLLEQFRVLTPDGEQHTVACYQDSHDRATSTGRLERVDTIRRYCLNGCYEVQPIDDDTFLTSKGVVLRRATTPDARQTI